MSEKTIAQLSLEAAENVQKVYEAGIAQGASIYCLPISKTSLSNDDVGTALDNLNKAQSTSLAIKDIRVIAANFELETIGANAFKDMENLRIIMPLYRSNGIETVSANAFSGCSALEIADLRNCKSFCLNAISGCTSLKKLYLSAADDVKILAEESDFPILNALNSYIWRKTDDGITYIGSTDGKPVVVRDIEDKQTVTIPESVKLIPKLTCTSVTELSCNAINPRCEKGFLYNLGVLTSLHINNIPRVYMSDEYPIALGELFSDEYDEETALNYNATFVPSSLTSFSTNSDVPKRFFEGLGKLESVEINGTSIGGNAFRNCTNLNSLTIGASVEKIGGELFYGCENIGGGITVDSENTKFCTDADGRCIFEKNNGNLKLIAYGHKTGNTELEIPDKINNISVTSIGGYAIVHGELRTLTIPNTITSIEDSFMNGIRTLESVEVSGDEENATCFTTDFYGNVGDDKMLYVADSLDYTLMLVVRSPSGEPITNNIKIIDGTFRIARFAFKRCRFKKPTNTIPYITITFPLSINSIDKAAFSKIEDYNRLRLVFKMDFATFKARSGLYSGFPTLWGIESENVETIFDPEAI